MERYALIHYGEIGLKQGNLEYFVDKLRLAVKLRLEERFGDKYVVKHTLGRLMVKLPADFVEADYADVLGKIFGIRNFKFCYVGSVELEELGGQILRHLPDLRDFETFRVKAKRSMVLPFKSVEAERELGAVLLRGGVDLKVKMKEADLIVDVEFFNELGFFSFKKYPGAGGLSPGSQGKLISLMSSGIDSPVASYLMMKRGARIIFAHFHGYPYTDKEESSQVEDLVKILSVYQFDTKLYLLPFGQVQRAIATNLDVPAKVRTVLYRRMMLRIAEVIAKKETAKGLVTGDSFGQVASQTPENMFAIHEASSIPLFQPLIGFDKEEVIELAERIGTFEISKLPCKDSCAMFMPKSPELKANIHDLRGYEEKLPITEWIEKVLAEAEVTLL